MTRLASWDFRNGVIRGAAVTASFKDDERLQEGAGEIHIQLKELYPPRLGGTRLLV